MPNICIYASVNPVNIGSDNRRQLVTKSIQGYCKLDTWEQFQRNFSQKSNFFIQANTFEKIVCKLAAILSKEDELNT